MGSGAGKIGSVACFGTTISGGSRISDSSSRLRPEGSFKGAGAPLLLLGDSGFCDSGFCDSGRIIKGLSEGEVSMRLV